MSESIHRWLRFPDSWPPSAVARLLEALNVGPQDAVYDPFVGSGTTPVAAALAGVRRTWSSDRSPLAVLSTLVKLRAYQEQELTRLQRIARSRALFRLLQGFSSGACSGKAHADSGLLTTFLLCGALIRTRWTDGAEFDLDRFREEVCQIAAEMAHDRHDLPPGSDHRVTCGVFPAFEPGEFHGISGRLVMISSPPFPGSNRNPRRDQLERLMDPDRTEPPPQGATLGVLNNDGYFKLLARLLSHAAECGCRGIALELGSLSQRSGASLEAHVTRMARSHGFRVVLLARERVSQESITTFAALRP